MSTPPIFIHSLFRTGSTYIWNKFRQFSQFYCCYEPFHQEMAQLELPANRAFLWGYDKKSTQTMRHPDLDRDYLEEYKRLLQPGVKGVPFFKKSFSFDDFCNSADDENPDQKRYLDNLLKAAGEKTPLFQFNRSAFRVSWFKKNYPHCLHIYLFRNPEHQFQSYMDMYKQNGVNSFLAMDLITAGVNRNNLIFRLLDSCVPVFEYHSPVFDRERLIYSQLLPAYSTAEKYLIFYFIWFRAWTENVLHGDMLLSIDELSKSASYREMVQGFFRSRDICSIDFSDADIREYKTPVLDRQEMKEIEIKAQSLILDTYTAEQIERITAKVREQGKGYVEPYLEALPDLKTKAGPKPPLPMKEMVIEKYDLVFKHFSRELVNWHYLTQEAGGPDKERNEILRLKNQVGQREQDLTQRNREILRKNREITRRDSQLEQKDRELTGKSRVIEEKDRELSERDKQLELKDLALIQKSRVIEEKDREISEKNKQLEMKERELAEKKRDIEEKILQLQQGNSRIEALLKEKGYLDRELEEKREEMDSLKEELSSLTSNRYFKILEALRLIRRKPDHKVEVKK